MTNVLRVKLNDSNDQMKDTLSPLVWRQFKFLDPDFQLKFANNEEKLRCLLSRFETFKTTFNTTDTIQSKILNEAVSEALIVCVKCQTFWPKQKIKCDNCKINIRSQSAEPAVKNTRVPVKNK